MVDGRSKPNATVFKKGQGGRKKGARNKFAKVFVEGVAKSWAEHGEQALEMLRKDKLEAYVKTAAALVPKQEEVQHSGNLSVSVVDYQEED